MLVTKDIDKKVFDHIDPWGKTLTYIVRVIRSSYHCNIMATPGQAVFGRDTIFNPASVVEWRVVTAANQQQLYIDNV